ncbi:hypothetical protein QYE76_015211 [Lolium multiflorum]|uniref:Uncharacterized protein n=1 Tax=Lolium multiflorum TaxID=4521 RepID=A0AAD8U670_LOLMU|nr:hypothetical protein QYE76_015211 [Lolium multiflorum]
MAKKKSINAPGSSKVSRDWGASTITSREVNKLRTLGFISSSDGDIRLPVAQPKKSWRNVLSPEESALADKLFEQVVDLKNAGGLTMCGTEVVSVFLKRRVQPLMSRPHQLWMYTGEGDKSRVSSADLSNDELRDEASTVVRCYPPTPESGVEPEDDDDSKETEDAQHALEDSDVQEEEALEDDALTRNRRRRRISDELITTADSDDEIPLAKRAKFSSGRPESGKESNPSPAKRTPPTRTTVEKIPVSKVIPSGDVSTPSTARDHPISVTVDAVADFADQFIRLESKNAQLRKTIKTSADQVLEANRLATNAQNENTLLKDELKKLKQKMKDDQDAKRKAAAAADEKEGVLRESVANLMSAADININRARKLQEDSMSDAMSLAAESNVQVLGLLQKTKGALSRLYSMIFPKMKQVKTLGEMAESFLINPSEPVEIPSPSSYAEPSLNPSASDESDLVRRLRDQISRLNKDTTNLHAMAALIKTKGEIATAVEQHALDRLRVATESLSFAAPDASEENKRIHEKIEAMTNTAHPKHELWFHRSKAVIVAKFEHRAEKVHYYFDKFHNHLAMVWRTLFPLDQAPETLSALFTRFKTPERIRLLVRKKLLAGVELAFASVLACHPTLDLEAIANTDRGLNQYYDVARNPAYIIVSRMETCIEKDLKAREEQENLP